jgi:hypothetical protein
LQAAPDVDLITMLTLLFVGLGCLAALTAWTRHRPDIVLICYVYVLSWAALTGTYAYIAQPLYGLARSAAVAGLAVAATPIAVYFVAPHARLPDGTVEKPTLTDALRVAAAGLIGAALLPVFLLVFVVALGVDGP